MRARTNPWPAFVDLFSALLIATFAGLIMFSWAYQESMGRYEKIAGDVREAQVEANKIGESLEQLLKNTGLGGKVRRCGDDTCIDLYIHFPKDEDAISSEQGAILAQACQILKTALDDLPRDKREVIEVIIEGHTDSQQIVSEDPRIRYLFNWNLSAMRATSVLYEFQKCGLAPPEYRIVAIGYADSMPLCLDSTPECYAQNRRTTLRLRIDTQRIEERTRREGRTE